MPRSYKNRPGVNLERGNPVDRKLGTDLLNPAGFRTYATGTGSTPTPGTVRPGEVFTIEVDIPAGANQGTHVVFSSDAPFKFKIVDIWLIVKSGGNVASSTAQVQSGGNNITPTISTATDKALVRPTTIDSTYSTIASGGSLAVVTASGATQAGSNVFLQCVRVA